MDATPVERVSFAPTSRKGKHIDSAREVHFILQRPSMTKQRLFFVRLPPITAHGEHFMHAWTKQERKESYDCSREALIDCDWFKYKVVMGWDPVLALRYQHDHTLIGPPNIPRSTQASFTTNSLQRIQLTKIGLFSHPLPPFYVYIPGHLSTEQDNFGRPSDPGPPPCVGVDAEVLGMNVFHMSTFYGSWLSLSF